MLEEPHIAEPEDLPPTQRPQQRARRRAFWLPVVIWMAGIFLVSSVPGAGPGSGFSLFATLGHLGAYSGLGFLVSRALYQYEERRGAPVAFAVAVVALCTLYGVLDELHQGLVRFRSPSYFDIGSDAVGACIGLGVFRLYTSLLSRRGSL